MRHEVVAPASGTGVLVTAQRRGATSGNGAQNFGMMHRQAVVFGEMRQRRAHDVAQG